jgi:two-component system chemotaxis sensor kinase CheA
MSFDWTSYIQTAKAETRERLQALNDGLLRLEAEPQNAQVINDVFRHAHSIKGAAQMVGLDRVSRVAHGLEDVLGAVRSGRQPVSAPLLDAAFQALDLIERLLTDAPDASLLAQVDPLLDQLRRQAAGAAPAEEQQAASDPGGAPAPEPEEREGEETIASEAAADPPPATTDPPLAVADPPAAAAAAPLPVGSGPASPQAAETMRVPIGRVDRLLGLAGELSGLEQQERVLLNGLRGLGADLRRLAERADGNGASPAGGVGEALSELHSRLGVLVRSARRLATDRALLGRELRDAAMDLRLLPAAVLFERFPRPVRDLARAARKEVHLVIEGEETRLDKRVLDELYDPLLHLLRNAVDHGIEPPAERLAAGKPATGTLTLRAVPHGREVLLQVSDDGRGILAEQVRQAACDRAFLTPAEAAGLSEDQLLQQLFRPGFSTATQVTAVSGRGVGLDVVAANVRTLNGVVRLETHPGRGTTFTVEIPLTLATTRVLLLECAGWVYALPGALVRGVLHVAPEAAQRALGRATIAWEGRTVPLLPLDTLLGLGPMRPAPQWRVVLVESAGHVVGLVTERLLDEEEVVLKPLGAILRQATLVSAGTVLGDGRVALLLNPDAVIAAGMSRRAVAPGDLEVAAPARRRSILLADDVLTTREIERAILETAGYEVVAVADGAAALAELARRDFDLVVTDIEMPHLDGVALTRAITTDARTAHLPVIIITSLAKEEDRRRGLEAGAAAYIVKSAFDQENLLDLVDRLTT